ncbi:DUF3592 domain-containing protein [Fulvivirga sp. 29W222]|uniref:DUF3592 domain-containing protein n=1 Tax=Fulvivirga marina TaxID=2494733 RepID=A0A937FZK1_9BACT|nr:DUF3592 domain-containing protein [Fulvivirga marina]MBL6447381.1 DUF3592 domain-containing protein [Fulvivirga marina]
MEVAEVQKQYIRELLIKGRKIEAIKYLRTNFDLTLKDAKRLAELIDEDIAEGEYIRKPGPFRSGGVSALTYVFGLIGAIMLGIGVYLYLSHRNFVKEAEQTVAVVIHNPSQPVFEYKFEGQTYTYYSNIESQPPSYSVGEEVWVYVNPDDPHDVLINTFMDRWFVITLVGGMGVIFSSVSLLVFFLTRLR